MSNFVYHIDETQYQEIAFNIKQAIFRIQGHNGFDDEGMRIAMPEILIQLLRRVPNMTTMEIPMQIDDCGNMTFMGYKVIEHYDNMVVVFHKDMPLLQNSSWEPVDLRELYKATEY